jgi:NADH/NAD ratio-sensing transcriptional regulator Rex/CheY-like chemotaxis protein
VIPHKTIDRLCSYRRILFRWHLRGKERFHSYELAQEAGITAAQVRRDLMSLKNIGTPRNGYATASIITELGAILEGAEDQKAVLVGAGKLGKAILSYFAGRRPNIRIVAAFDSDPTKVGSVLAACPCLPLTDLDETVRRHGALVAILTVPGSAAQEIATALVGAGIRAIINFSPAKLKVPEGIYIDDIDFSIALEKAVYFGRTLKDGTGIAPSSGPATPISEGSMHGALTKRILCIDDDLDVIESYRAILEQTGYEVAVALDGESGLEEARSHKPDLIILDVMMKDATEGFHIAYALRADAALREVPILMLTAISSEWNMKFDKDQDGAYLPVDAFVDKPVAPDTLLATVKRLLGLPREQINIMGSPQS